MLPDTVSQLFPPRDQLCFCGRHESASALEKEENRPGTDCPPDIKATGVRSLVTKLSTSVATVSMRKSGRVTVHLHLNCCY